MTEIDNKIMHLNLILFQFHVFIFNYLYWILNLFIKFGNYSGYKCNYGGVYNDTTLNISKVIVSCKYNLVTFTGKYVLCEEIKIS